ncbi:MAG: hypothetical protein JST21_02325, partial [Bacteroidetes bacterium]|nr:hypothetical protein [Bacteroidota bacterium]
MPQDWNNIMVVTADELVPHYYNCIKTLQSDIARHINDDYGIKRVQKGGNGRQMLIAFDSLPPEIKNALGDPRKITNPLEMFYSEDKAAGKFYSEFRFEDESGLSLKHIEEYVTNASVLRAAIALKSAREYERKSKGGSLKCIMKTICSDVILFNEVLQTKYKTKHTLPSSEKRFKEAFKLFENSFDYLTLISRKLRNENRRIVTDDLLEFLNDLFATQDHKPTRTEIVRQYDSFLAGYLEVTNTTTGELYNPADFTTLSESTIRNYLDKWKDKIATHKMRSGDRQRYMGSFKTYHSLDKPSFAGSIISIDDRQPPFKYDSNNNRVWFYNGIDLGSEAWVCWVHGKSKDGIIIDFYRQLVRNYVQWGIKLPAELECESNLNASFSNTFLRNGMMFDEVRIEANNARGKRIERYFQNLRYGNEKQRTGWLARPHARSEANQAGRRNAFVSSKEEDISKAPIIPYNVIVEGSLRDIEEWNNSPHSVHT